MQIDQEAKLTKPILWLMTIVSGIVVANNYYSQPLLAMIGEELGISESAASSITVCTQVGYAVGLLFIIPLGDKLYKRKLILTDLILVFLALIGMALSKNLHLMYLMSFLIGCFSVIPQLFVPMVAALARPEDRAQQIGMVMSGLLMGILLSRFIGGIVGDLWGWQSIYWAAACFMVISWVFVYKMLPEVRPNFKGSYGSLMASVFNLATSQPILQLAAFRGAMGFASLCVVFTTLPFHLEEAPFHAGPSVAGSFGLIGAVGALAAALVDKVDKKMSRKSIIMIGLLFILLSWMFIYFSGNSYWGLIVGIILIDLGLQSSHIMNQADYFAIKTDATSRLNTVYMVLYFIGGSLGSLLGGYGWQHYGWFGVFLFGAGFALLGLLAHLLFYNKVMKAQQLLDRQHK